MENNNGLPVVLIACKVFEGLLEKHFSPGVFKKITFLDYGLHSQPRLLKDVLQEHIDGVGMPSLVVLGYGLCGNGLDGVKAGVHTLLIPRTDDCIAMLLGSYAAYRREFENAPGTYYLSKGWLESGSNPLQEYHGYVEKYGQERAEWLMDQQYRNYKRIALVAHNPADLEAYRAQAQEVAGYCAQWGMRYEEILGSETYARRLVEVASSLDEAGDDFLVIPPGGQIKQSMFWR